MTPKPTAPTYERHPLSALFAQYDMAGDELQTLVDDLKANGLHLPITLHEGKILDGWNRYQGCQIAKVRPIFISLAPGLDPWEFVKSANMLRRHMTPAERVTVMLLKMRMEEGECPILDTPSAREISKDLEVSRGTANLAQQVAKAQDPALVDALAGKRVSLPEAAKLAEMPAEERQAELDARPDPKKRAPRAPKDPEPAPKSGPVLTEPPAPAPPAPDDRDARIAQLENLLKERDKEIASLRAKLAEAGTQVLELNEENESYRRVLDAEGDDLLARFDEECRRNQERARVAESQKNGFMDEAHDLAKRLRSANQKIQKLGGKAVKEPTKTTTEEDEINATFKESA
jgi:hypothetical protein